MTVDPTTLDGVIEQVTRLRDQAETNPPFDSRAGQREYLQAHNSLIDYALTLPRPGDLVMEVETLTRLENRIGVLEEESWALEYEDDTRHARLEALARLRSLVSRAAGAATVLWDQARKNARRPPPAYDHGEDLTDWSAYPKVPVPVVNEMKDLCLFLGGDTDSFTGNLLRMMAKADPDNLNRLGSAFPRHMRAWVLWRACAPIPSDTLVRLLEFTEKHPVMSWKREN